MGVPNSLERCARAGLADSSRLSFLSDYFWACVQCYNDEPASLLEPIVDAWAMMPDEEESSSQSPRVGFADELRWALQESVPERAIGYLLKRAEDPELRRPIRVMLDGIDNPQAVEFVVRVLAQQVEATESFSMFVAATDEWSLRRRGERNPDVDIIAQSPSRVVVV